MNQDSEYTYLFKFVLVGDQGVGKSCILSQYISDFFRDEYEQTIGVEFESKIFDIDEEVRIQVQAWDTAGDSQFKAITRSFFKNSAAAIFVYDTTNRNSFESIKNWYNEFIELASDQVQLALIGTKIDYEQLRQVSYKEGQELADQLNCKFHEINCHCKESIDQIFNTITLEVIKSLRAGKIDPLDEQYGVKASQQAQHKLNNNNENGSDNTPELISSPQDSENLKAKNPNKVFAKYLMVPILIGTLFYYFIQ